MKLTREQEGGGEIGGEEEGQEQGQGQRWGQKEGEEDGGGEWKSATTTLPGENEECFTGNTIVINLAYNNKG